MNLMFLWLFSILLVAAGGAFLWLGIRWMNTGEIKNRLEDYVEESNFLAQNRTLQQSELHERELNDSFVSRTILPLFRQIGRFFGRLMPQSSIQTLNHQLSIAGNPLGISAREFYGIRMFLLLLGFYLAYRLLVIMPSFIGFVTSLLAFLICYQLPRAWLKRVVRKRQDKIRRGLPDALDMLSVCADAGLGFDQALQRVSDYWKTPVGIELGRVVAEMEMGVSRQTALRNLSRRLEVEELTSFVAVIIQSDQLGMSITETLHAQSKQMREERRFRAQEEARKMPVKMLFPMLFFIFPAMFAVILGPMIPALVEFFRNMRNNLSAA